jgi:phosphatidylglycerophosphatase A
MNTVIKYFVSLFGIGFIPIAPGTLGSIFAIFVWYLSIKTLNIYFFYLVFVLIFLIAFKAVDIYLKSKRKEDPSEVIIDEFIGQSIPLLFLIDYNLYEVLLVFCSFRFFDITKIYPIDWAEKMSGAKGVIIDDIIAGIYSLVIIMFYKIILSI